MTVLLETLGASTESGAVEKVNGLKSFETAMLTALDVKDSVTAVEKIAQLSQAAIDAHAELARVTKEAEQVVHLSRVDALMQEGKLLPSQKEFAVSLNAEQLDQFSKTLSAVSAISKSPVTESESADVEVLSQEDKDACKALGLVTEDHQKAFLANKKAKAAERAERGLN